MSDFVILIRTQVSHQFAALFEDAGHRILAAPVMTIQPVLQRPDYVARCINDSDIAIGLSQNAVKQLYYYQGKLEHSAEVWAVGKQTAAQLSTYMGKVSYPPVETSEGLWQCLKGKIKTGTKITFIKGLGGRDTLIDELLRKGANVKQLNLYQRVENVHQRAEITKSIEENEANTAIIGSSELLEIAMNWWPDKLPQKSLIVPSERVALRAREMGLSEITVANGATADHFLAVLQDRKSA